ncbi:MAG TPA: hypothetical protein VIE65_03515 [Methylobacter sp.]
MTAFGRKFPHRLRLDQPARTSSGRKAGSCHISGLHQGNRMQRVILPPT